MSAAASHANVEEENKSGELVEQASEAICLLDSAFRITYASPSMRIALGYSVEEHLDLSLFDLVADGQKSDIRQIADQLLLTPERRTAFHAWMKHKGGSPRWMVGVLTNRLHEPNVAAIVLSCHDLTEYKQAEQTLQDSENQFRSFFEMLGVGTAEVDPLSGRFVRVNRKFAEICGYPAGELLALDSRELTHPDDTDRDWDLWQHCLAEGRSEYTTEKRLMRKDGTPVWVQVTASFVRDEHGRPTRGALIVRDVTDRRHAIESLQRSREELERRVERRTAELATANQRLETLIAASPLSIISLEPDLIVRRWNPASEALFGWKEAEVLGKLLPILPHEDRGRYEQEVRRLLTDPRLRHLETVTQHRNGELLNVSIWRAPLYDAQNTLTGSMAIIMDITERNRLERALLDASEREQRRIGQDLHDQLCQHLLGVACMLKSMAINAERQVSVRAEDLHQAAHLVNQSVQQTRDIARGLHPVELDAEGLMSALRGLAQQVSASIPCELECKRPVLIKDSDAAMHFYRIAQEAVTNALKHAHAGHILIRLSEDAERIQLEVFDDGCGIEANGTRNRGMGLDIMKYRAHAIGGRFVLETQPSGGTRVACSIPKPK